ncbi:MAG: NUDIX domain-containing protein [Verrucomicrobia bacterium]|nr:NUDIX domain-containing protein [Verrucomicrobiota bacterium]
MNVSDEKFDLVDRNDRVVGSAPRSEIHASGLLHRAVHLWLFHDDGRLLLQRRSLTKDREPGRWTSSVSGHVNAGEEYDTAMHREILEEIGIPSSACHSFLRLRYFPACQETDQEFVWLYRAFHSGPFKPDPTEVASLEWFFPNQLDQMISKQPDDFCSCLRFFWKQQPK